MLDTVNNEGYIKEREIELGEHVKLVISLKLIESKQLIDVRKWYKFGELTDFFPTKKGLMLTASEWKAVINKINEFMDEKVADAA